MSGVRAPESSPASTQARDLPVVRPRIPVSTYRLQFHSGFTFADAEAIVAYLARLGISDGYASPYLAAAPGTRHGYDVAEYDRLNPELGTEADYERLVETLARHGMGHLLDFVPNHMGIASPDNRWWQDILENGVCSPYGRFFDITWDAVQPELKGKVLLPILEDQYGAVLEAGLLRVTVEEGGVALQYRDRRLPLDPQTAPQVLGAKVESLIGALGEDHPHVHEFLSILRALRHLPARTEVGADRVAERRREHDVARRRLIRLMTECPALRDHLDDTLAAINGTVGRPESFDALHAVLEQQVYRLAFWRTAGSQINYRRFFDVNDLAGLRMEDPDVFAATHAFLFRLIERGHVTGIRLDHPDGLFDPGDYCDALQEAILCRAAARDPRWQGLPPETLLEAVRARRNAARSDPGDPAIRPFYLVVEKILSDNERLRERWPIHGTTGYDFMTDVNALFVDRTQERLMTKVYERFTGERTGYAETVYEGKRLIMATAMASELSVLAHALHARARENRRTRDFTLDGLWNALREVVACFPRYRAYLNAVGEEAQDRASVGAAIDRAKRRHPAVESSIFEFLRRVLLGTAEADRRDRDIAITMKWQQYTGPVQAKGVEDTAFYRYVRLVSLNEVGGSPDRFGIEPAEFHQRNAHRRAHWPSGLLATATHDHKRGEDVRARLNVLSEMPDEWGRAVRYWARLHRRHRHVVDGRPAPDRHDEYLFYQTLVGMWPVEAPDDRGPLVERLVAYMRKATKEAKTRTSWVNPNEVYDDAVTSFVREVLTGRGSARFFADMLPFQRRVARLGAINSLAQVVLKVTSPGVPDFYQGTEWWDLSLVDPDNRQPVDFGLRDRFLREMEPWIASPASDGKRAFLSTLLRTWPDGRIKLFVTAAALRERAENPAYAQGAYVPLPATGSRARHVVAFLRRTDETVGLTIVPRLVGGLLDDERAWPVGGAGWNDTTVELPGEEPLNELVDGFSGETVRPIIRDGRRLLNLAEVWAHFPVALLRRREGSSP